MIHRSADRTQIANQILAALIAMIDFAIQFEDKQTCSNVRVHYNFDQLTKFPIRKGRCHSEG